MRNPDPHDGSGARRHRAGRTTSTTPRVRTGAAARAACRRPCPGQYLPRARDSRATRGPRPPPQEPSRTATGRRPAGASRRAVSLDTHRPGAAGRRHPRQGAGRAPLRPGARHPAAPEPAASRRGARRRPPARARGPLRDRHGRPAGPGPAAQADVSGAAPSPGVRPVPAPVNPGRDPHAVRAAASSWAGARSTGVPAAGTQRTGRASGGAPRGGHLDARVAGRRRPVARFTSGGSRGGGPSHPGREANSGSVMTSRRRVVRLSRDTVSWHPMEEPSTPAARTATIGVEAFDVAYGAGFQAEDESPHALDCEPVEDGDAFAAHRPVPATRPRRVAFVDGTLRTEARLTYTGPHGDVPHGAGGKLGRWRGARPGRGAGPLRAGRGGAYRDLHGRPSGPPPGAPRRVALGAARRRGRRHRGGPAAASAPDAGRRGRHRGAALRRRVADRARRAAARYPAPAQPAGPRIRQDAPPPDARPGAMDARPGPGGSVSGPGCSRCRTTCMRATCGSATPAHGPVRGPASHASRCRPGPASPPRSARSTQRRAGCRPSRRRSTGTRGPRST